jgi:S1-C subfamily serine protease
VVRGARGVRLIAAAARLVAAALVVAALGTFAARPAAPTGWIGIALAEGSNPRAPAVRIETVLADSPASAAGLRAGDVVRAVRTHPVRVARDVTERVRRTRPETVLAMRVERAGTPLDVDVRVGARPPDVDRCSKRSATNGRSRAACWRSSAPFPARASPTSARAVATSRIDWRRRSAWTVA